MNTLEKYIIRSPNNTDEECGKFIIDETSRPFILHDIAQAGGQYAFSAWIKSSSSRSISIGGQTFNLTTEWTKCFSTFFSDSEDVEICFMAAGEYYFYRPKLEVGNKSTDWTPAPEDMVDKANIISCINQTAEEITIQANKISLEGLITANGGFKILSDGSMETISGKIGGWSIGDTNIHSENPFTEETLINSESNYYYHNEGTSSVYINSNFSNDEIISIAKEGYEWYTENGVIEEDGRQPFTEYTKIFSAGKLKLGYEGIWIDDIPSISTTEIEGGTITIVNSSQEESICTITGDDIVFSGSYGEPYSLKRVMESLLDKTYPIGAIYMSVDSTNPSSLFGGTWVSWGSGRVPVGVNTSDSSFNTVEKTGGEKSHRLTVNEMPAHTHGTGGNNFWIGSNDKNIASGKSTGRTTISATASTGGSGYHNNLQPYITCYMWKRTA